MRRFVVIAVLATFTINCAHVPGPYPDSTIPSRSTTLDWASVKALRPQSTVALTLVTGERLRGKLVTVDDQRLVISSDQSVEVMRSSIQRVTLFTGLARSARAKRGFLVGAAAGALVAALTVESNRGPWMLMLSSGWGALGALFSALDGSTREAIIYEGARSGDP